MVQWTAHGIVHCVSSFSPKILCSLKTFFFVFCFSISVPKCQPNGIEGKLIIMHTGEHNIHTAGVELPLGFMALRWCAAGCFRLLFFFLLYNIIPNIGIWFTYNAKYYSLYRMSAFWFISYAKQASGNKPPYDSEFCYTSSGDCAKFSSILSRRKLELRKGLISVWTELAYIYIRESHWAQWKHYPLSIRSFELRVCCLERFSKVIRYCCCYYYFIIQYRCSLRLMETYEISLNTCVMASHSLYSSLSSRSVQKLRGAH